jgi:hypothetical protein
MRFDRSSTAARVVGVICLLTAISVLGSCGRHEHSDNPRQSATTPAKLKFTDVTRDSGLTFFRFNGAFGLRWMPEIFGGGGAFMDYDNDGWPDILLINGDWWPGHARTGRRPTLALYHNDRNGHFTETTAAAGMAAPIQGMGVAVGDYDNDGWDDIFITGVSDCRLYHNVAGKRFDDVTTRTGIDRAGWSTSAAWLDFDKDGRLDLFVCHYLKWSAANDVYCGTSEKTYCRPQEYSGESCRLYRNLGGGRFADVSKRAGVWNNNSKALGVAICDLDGDGYPDILVANDMEPNFVFRNLRNGAFREEGFDAGMAVDEQGRVRGGMGVDVSKKDAGGSRYVGIGNFFNEGMSLYRTGQSGPMSDGASMAGLRQSTAPYVTFGLFFSDLNNDGLDDIVLTNGHVYDNVQTMDPSESFLQPTQIFVNQGRGKFLDSSRSEGASVTQPIAGRAACSADYDNDGRVDVLLVPNSGAPVLLHNETPHAGQWIGFRLIGAQSNSDGYGATVTIRQQSGAAQSAYARSGSSYLSASDRRVHFGLGKDGSVSTVTVTWPSSVAEVWGPFAAGKYVTLKEGTGTRKVVARRGP